LKTIWLEQRAVDVPDKSTHVSPFEHVLATAHGLSDKYWHVVPVRPTGHWHEKLLNTDIHVPPLRQGEVG